MNKLKFLFWTRHKVLAATCKTLDTTLDFRAGTWNVCMKTFRISRILKSEVPVELKSPRITKKDSLFPEGWPVCTRLTSLPQGYFPFKISRDTIHLPGESPGCGRCPCLWQGGGRRWAWSFPSKPTPSGMILPLPHFVTVSPHPDHNLQWQKDAAVQVITLNWEPCLASFNLCHLPARQSNECTQKSLHKIIQHCRRGDQQRETPAGMGVFLLH